LVSAALVATVVLTASPEAWARHRRYRYWAPTYQYYYSAPAPAAPAPAPAVTQRNPAGYTYRSFSYDAAPGTIYVAPGRPTYYQPLEPSQSHFFRADRKSHGLSWYRTQ